MGKTDTNTIIIGAGIAGIKASQDLTKAGISNLVLEARDRLGGRLFTDKLNSGFPIDMGASWFHDCYDNPLLEKYWKNGKTEFTFDDGSEAYFNEDGRISENSRLKPIFEEIELFMAESYDKLKIDQDISVREAVYQYLQSKKYCLTDYQIRHVPQLVRGLELWIGSSWDILSSRNIAADVHKGRNALVLNGYSTVFNGELDELIDASKYSNVKELLNDKSKIVNKSGEVSIKLNQSVYRIEYDNTNKYIKVYTKDTINPNNIQIFTCENIIFTAPLSILKLSNTREKGSIEWVPKLPTKLTNALERVSFSNLGKIFFEFPEIFWSLNDDRFHSLAKVDEKFYNACKNDLPNGPSSYKFEISREDIPIPKGSVPNGLDYTILFVNLAVPTGKPVILALTSSPLTQFLEESDSETIFKVFKPVFARISGKSINEIPNPIEIKTSHWSNDPFARGSYTGVTIGDNFEDALEILCDPKEIFDGTGRVRFAGEGIIDDGNGCAHAAWKTGKREANYIIKKVNNGKL